MRRSPPERRMLESMDTPRALSARPLPGGVDGERVQEAGRGPVVPAAVAARVQSGDPARSTSRGCRRSACRCRRYSRTCASRSRDRRRRRHLPDKADTSAVRLVAIIQTVGRALGVDAVHHVEEGGRVRPAARRRACRGASWVKTTMPTSSSGRPHTRSRRARAGRGRGGRAVAVFVVVVLLGAGGGAGLASGGCGAWRSRSTPHVRPGVVAQVEAACSPSRHAVRHAAPSMRTTATGSRPACAP